MNWRRFCKYFVEKKINAEKENIITYSLVANDDYFHRGKKKQIWYFIIKIGR